jgi:hypothetical protein
MNNNTTLTNFEMNNNSITTHLDNDNQISNSNEIINSNQDHGHDQEVIQPEQEEMNKKIDSIMKDQIYADEVNEGMEEINQRNNYEVNGEAVEQKENPASGSQPNSTHKKGMLYIITMF